MCDGKLLGYSRIKSGCVLIACVVGEWNWMLKEIVFILLNCIGRNDMILVCDT